jgi:hypothetical protein
MSGKMDDGGRARGGFGWIEPGKCEEPRGETRAGDEQREPEKSLRQGRGEGCAGSEYVRTLELQGARNKGVRGC